MKYVILLSSVLMQACLGGLYAWSSFVAPLRNSYGLSTVQTQIVFGCLILVFTIAMVYAGRSLTRRGPRFVAGIGGILFGSGYLVASCSGGSFSILLLGISLLAGIGTGFSYVCPLAMCAEWFPNRKGLATGIAVAGFGGGAVILSIVVEFLLSQGMDVLRVFRWVGISYAALIVIAAMPLKFPPSHDSSLIHSTPATSVLLRDRFLWGLFAGMFAGTFAGLLVVGNLKPIALASNLTAAVATVAISGFATGNALGRIAWGWVADKLRINTIPLSLMFLLIPLFLLALQPSSAITFVGVSTAIGFGFGACFVVYAAQVGSRYGLNQVGGMYPPVFLAYGASGILGPWLCGWLYDSTASHSPGILAGVAVVIIGVLVSTRLLGLWVWRRAPTKIV